MDNIPAYRHIKEVLREEIRQGKYKPGDKLPSSNELAAMFGTSRNTSVKALTELVFEGVASAVKGSGTVVNDLTSAAAPVRRKSRKECPDIGLLLADLDDLNHPYISRILQGISNRAKTLPCTIRIFCIRNASIAEFAKQRAFDGLIVITELPDSSVLLMKREKIPFVLLGNDLAGEEVASVANDSFSGVSEAMRHLHDLGHRSIGVLSGPSGRSITACGYLAYRQMLQELGLSEEECFFKACDWGEKAGYEVFGALLKSGKRPTALFAFEDYMACGAIRAAKEFGLRVPEDLSVIGFGNYSGAPSPVPLTTVDAFNGELGAKSLELITDILKGKAVPDRKIFVKPLLIERESCRKTIQRKDEK